MLLGVLTAYCLRYLREESTDVFTTNLEQELAILKAKCMEAGSQTEVLNRPCHANIDSGPAEIDEDDIKAIIFDELKTFGYDKTGKADFALEKLGACVVTTRNTKDVVTAGSYFGIFKEKSDPNEILRPSMTPGSCWAFDGSSGTVVIQLMDAVVVEEMSLEHISPVVTPSGEIWSAPKTFSLWGLDSVDTENRHKFGTFVYKIDGLSVQTFSVQKPSPRHYRLVEVSFHNNHGNQNYTCVYRVRIHGKLNK